MPSPQDLEALKHFYLTTRELALRLADKGQDGLGNQLISDADLALTRAAAKEYEETHPAADDLQKIGDISDERARAFGLAGRQLDLKLSTWRRFKEMKTVSGERLSSRSCWM